MADNYVGNYPYNKFSIITYAPDKIGVYYCGVLNNDRSLGVLYVGRAKGENISIKSRLLEHFNNSEWPDVTHFGFCVCSTESEVENLEKTETIRLECPKYNKRIG